MISKRRKFAGTKYAVDESDNSGKFAGISQTLREVADNLENDEFSEDARINAIKAIMPLIGKMRAGIQVNEEDDDMVALNEESDDDDEDDVEDKDIYNKEDDDSDEACGKKKVRKIIRRKVAR